MTKYIVALAAAGALLMVACGEPAGVPESDSTRPASAEAEPTDLRVNGSAGPDIDLGDDTEWTIWARVNAADAHGISVNKVQDGDELTIETLSGVAYFGGKSGWWQVLSAIYKVSGAVVPTGSTAANVITALSEETLPDGGSADDGVSKPRDAYGKQLDSRDGAFAEEEGGIVVCMPNAAGPMYAHGANHFTKEGQTEDRSDSRGMKNNSEMPDKCFPVTRDRTVYTIKGDGVLYIYAFDRNYADNAGSYEIKFRIERPS